MDPFKSPFQVLSDLRPVSWLALAGVILLGVWARFASLHAASLAADEYYLLQSANNILKFGLPQFECGGYYTRGLLHQYLSASFMLLGLESGEAAIRLPSVLSSLVALAGAFFLARHVAGWRVACLLVMLLSVSLWEVEFARFGRMYALFQAITVVYALVTLKYLEGESRQFWWMAALGILGVLSHEGGLLLVVFTLIAVFARPQGVSGRHAAVALVMLLAGVKMQVTDFRFLGVEQPYSPQLLATAANPDSTWGPFELPTLFPVPLPLAIASLLIAIAMSAIVSRAYVREHPPGVFRKALVWGASMGIFLACVAHQWLLSATLLAIAVSLRLFSARVLISANLRHALLLFALIYLGLLFGALLYVQPPTGSAPNLWDGLVHVSQVALRYPDFYGKVFLPWGHVLPLLGVLILVVTGCAWLLAALSPAESQEERRYLILSGLTLTLLCGAVLARQPYTATRYTFFIYPLLLLLLLQGAVLISRRLFKDARAPVAALVVVVACFLMSNDFHWTHLTHIGDRQFIYRLGYNRWMQEHLYRHWDFRSVGAVLDARAGPQDLVIATAYPVMPYYSKRLDFVYLDRSSKRIWVVSACGGRKDLWSNLPLKFDPDELMATVTQSTVPVWIVVTTARFPAQRPVERELLTRFASAEVFRSVDGNLALLRIAGPEPK
jgi:hypothetical protein